MRAIRIVAFIIAAFALMDRSYGCSMTACLRPGTEFFRSFSVNVVHDGRPLPGVTVTITRELNGDSAEQFKGKTDEEGKIRKISLPPGDYWISVEYLGISAGNECFQVFDRETIHAKSKLKYEWGDDAPAVSQVTGKLIDSQSGQSDSPIWNIIHRVDVPITGAKLILDHARNGSRYETHSGDDGSFDFQDVTPGTYVLHVGGGRSTRDYDATDTLLRVSSKAKKNSILLKRRDPGSGSCGGTYLELQTVDK
ncbi:MAG: hypothetical protein ABL967_20190 [Bryobacteraceae bacterium]